MSITDQINQDLKEAIKSQDKLKLNTLRLIKATLKIERNEAPLSQAEEEARLFKAAKQRKDSAQTFLEANRKDLADNELKELEIIEKYLPKQLSKDEITVIVKEVIKEVGASSIQEIGNVMKILMPKLKGKADGKLIQEITRGLLN